METFITPPPVHTVHHPATKLAESEYNGYNNNHKYEVGQDHRSSARPGLVKSHPKPVTGDDYEKSKVEAAETRRRIVDSALEAFRARGIEATSVGDVMAAAGLTHGGFYRHFDSKNQLVAEACTHGVKAMVESVSDICAHTVTSDSALPVMASVAEAFLSTSSRDERAAG